MSRKFKRCIEICLLAVLMTFTAVGCGSENADVPQEKSVDSEAWIEDENSQRKETEVEEDKKDKEKAEDDEISADDESNTEDDFMDVDSVEDGDINYAKYEEKESTIKGVTYSNGGQNEQDAYQTDPVPQGKQNPVEPGDIEIDTTKELTCYLTISCANILNNMQDLTPGKESLVPSDGIILRRSKVTFYEGESVFDVLARETRNNRIHMEYEDTPMYNSAYIEGINNLYEFDCGRRSGWMYCVNGWYPNYGCSRYVVQNGDEIEWNYTCDLGEDNGQSWMD